MKTFSYQLILSNKFLGIVKLNGTLDNQEQVATEYAHHALFFSVIEKTVLCAVIKMILNSYKCNLKKLNLPITLESWEKRVIKNPKIAKDKK